MSKSPGPYFQTLLAMMKQEIEILNLPMSAVARISKLVAPDVKFTEEAKLAVNRAAGMFVLYTSMMAWEVATTQKRKTIRSSDIIKFLNDSGQEDIVAALSNFDGREKSKNRKALPKILLSWKTKKLTKDCLVVRIDQQRERQHAHFAPILHDEFSGDFELKGCLPILLAVFVRALMQSTDVRNAKFPSAQSTVTTLTKVTEHFPAAAWLISTYSKENGCDLANGHSSSGHWAKSASRPIIKHVVLQEELDVLKSSPALLKLLQSSASLRSLLPWVDQHPTPSAALGCAMKEPDFRRFCSLCLEALGSERNGTSTAPPERNAEAMLMALLTDDSSQGSSL